MLDDKEGGGGGALLCDLTHSAPRRVVADLSLVVIPDYELRRLRAIDQSEDSVRLC